MLRLEFCRLLDGSLVLRCVRQDTSVTWQKQTKHAGHFVFHDLTHYAVETTLGCARGFFGLIAQGWDIEDTTGKGGRGAVPEEAADVERIVGLFDSERASAILWTLEEFNEFAPRPLTTTEIQEIRRLRSELFARWLATEPGGKLHFQFEPGSSSTI